MAGGFFTVIYPHLPEIGAVPITTLSTGDVQRLVDGIAAAKTAEHGRKALTTLRVALRVAVRYGEIALNPCAGVRVPTSAGREKPARILTPEEAAAIIAQAEKDDSRAQLRCSTDRARLRLRATAR